MKRPLLRTIDANCNRAREALRVLEDFARFTLDDAAASKQLKQMRHALAGIESTWPAAQRLAARDTPGDVGTRITTHTESARTSTAEILTAAAKRLAEALRVIEECAKTDHPKTAARAERLRYEAYAVEKTLIPRAQRPDFAAVRLYVLITESLCRKGWFQTARDVLRGGADALQLREKELGDADYLDRARRLVDLCHKHNTLCIINDRPGIAALAGADGVHLGQTDLSVADARAIVGPAAVVGKSTHNLGQVRAGLRERPDYLAIGPMYASATKPQKHVAGPAILGKVLAMAGTTPIVAIGGITTDGLGPITGAGVTRVAVCSAVISQPDPTKAARALKRRLAAATPARRGGTKRRR